MTPLQAAALLVELEESAVPDAVIVIVEYLDPSGEAAFKYHVISEMNISNVVGLLQVVSNDLMRRASGILP